LAGRRFAPEQSSANKPASGKDVTNYLSTYGDSHVAGVVYVDGVIEVRPDLLISHSAASAAIASDDLQQHLEGTREFLEQCFFQRPDPKGFELLYANAALASPEMSRVIGQISVPAEVALPRVTKPVLLLYGERDALVRQTATVSLAKKLMPHATAIIYEAVGHAPFLESPQRFNEDLARFVQASPQ
jgi:non-heme chloroperoxidase